MLYHCPDDNNIVMPRALISIVILCFIIIIIIVPSRSCKDIATELNLIKYHALAHGQALAGTIN